MKYFLIPCLVHYEEFVELYKKYKSQGLEILAFPINQFWKQEPKPEAEIKQFAASYGVTFPLFSKIKVNGKEAHPLFLFIRKHLPGILGTSVKWNWEKFLCSPEGLPVKRCAVTTSPKSMETAIVAELEKLKKRMKNHNCFQKFLQKSNNTCTPEQ